VKTRVWGTTDIDMQFDPQISLTLQLPSWFLDQTPLGPRWSSTQTNSIRVLGSSCSFKANAVRLHLHALACSLANFLRTLALLVERAKYPMTPPRNSLVKTGAKIVPHTRPITFQMARKNPSPPCAAPSVPADTMRSIDKMTATSSCRRTGASEGK